MFKALTYLQFALACVFLLVSPLMALTGKKGYKFFGILLFELYVAQFFMYSPGSDVSPYAFATQKINAVRIAGLTLSALVSIVLIIYIFFDVLLKRRRYTSRAFVMLILAFVPNLIGILFGAEGAGGADYFLKIMSPFVIGFYLNVHVRRANLKWFKRLIMSIHLLLVLQVFVCKILEGSFAAHNYYYEMAEEYFGYYNHPHSFTGLLAFMCVWNIYEINRREHVKTNMILLLMSLVLMYISGVRTYFVALAAGLCYIGIYALKASSMKNLRKYVYAAFLVVLVAGPSLLGAFGAARTTADFSSGRIARWTADILYTVNNHSAMELLIGGGLEASVVANKQLFGVAINSLNIFVDMFMDYGIVGAGMMIAAYIYLFRLTWTKHTRGFQSGMAVMFFVACFINSIVAYITIMAMIVLILNVMKIEGEGLNEGSRIKSASVSRGA